MDGFNILIIVSPLWHDICGCYWDCISWILYIIGWSRCFVLDL